MTQPTGCPYPQRRGPSNEPGTPNRPFTSEALRQFARGQDLMMPWCNHDPATTQHPPLDFLGFHGCSECHRREKEAGYDDILRALMITQTRIYQHFGTLTP